MVDEKNDKTDKTDKKDENINFDLLGEGKAKLADILNKVVATGVTAAFMTEEGVRNYLSDAKLPKDVLQGILAGASKSKDEITNRVSKEIIGIVNKIDWIGELSKFAEDHTFKITAEIDIKKKKKTENT